MTHHTYRRIHDCIHIFTCILKLLFLLHSAKAEHVDEFFLSCYFPSIFLILIYPVIVRAYIAYYVESHIRRVYTPVSLCEIIRIVRARARQCACAREYVCVCVCVQAGIIQDESNLADRKWDRCHKYIIYIKETV